MNYVPGFSNYLQQFAEGGSAQGLPTEQAVAAQPAYQSDEAYAQELREAARRAYENARLQSFAARGELGARIDRIDPTVDFDYSPAAVGYMRDVQDYLTNNDTGYDLSPMYVGLKVDPQTGAPMPLTAPELEGYAKSPVADQFYANFNYSDPEGKGWDVGNLRFAPKSDYRLIDRKTGEELYSGTGYEAGQNISNLAKGLFDKSGQKADWVIQEAAPGSGQWTQRYEHKPEVNTLANIIGTALPIATAFIPGLNVLGTIAAATAAGGAGAAIKGDDILKGALLSGLTAGALKVPLPGGGGTIGSAIGNVVSKVPVVGDVLKGVGQSFSGAGGQVIGDEIVVNAARGLAPGVTQAVGQGALSQLAQNALPKGIQPKESLTGDYGDLDPIATVTGNRGAALVQPGVQGTLTGALNAAMPGTGNYGDQLWNEQQTASTDEPTATVVGTVPAETPLPPYDFNADFDATFPRNEVVVEGARKPEEPTPLPGVTPPPVVEAPLSNEIVVEGTRKPEIAAPPVIPPLSLGEVMTTPPTSLAPDTSLIKDPETLQPEGKPGMSLSDIIDYLRLAGLGVSTVGSLFGGGNQQGAKLPAGFGSGALNPTFGAKLPGATIPGLGGGAGNAPRTPLDLAGQGLRSPQDYYRYGYGPEQSFFGYVPQGTPNTSQAYTGYERGLDLTPQKAFTGYAKGGFAVEGPGDGREDKIPAMLSDGEYVIDAETVALLGNGSNKAGADMLDKFRVNVRKHKGRELSRGEFSKNAKKPEQYLAGGRT